MGNFETKFQFAMLFRVTLLMLAGCSLALKLNTAAASRRALLHKAVTAVPLIVSAPALAELTPKEAASRSFKAGPKSLGAEPFVGTFEDPAHSLAKRTISYIGGRDYQIDGADEDGKPWRAIATRKGASSIAVDFSAKGGPSAVEAKQLVKSGDLKFPDGNVWKRV